MAERKGASRTLRSGYTTGACAAAAAKAAVLGLLGRPHPGRVAIPFPDGSRHAFDLCRFGTGLATVVKDAGDDPDVTNGAEIGAEARWLDEPGGEPVALVNGPGVGVVTKPGLPVPVGEPAINPVPRRMISEHLQRLADECGYFGGFEVTVNVQGGDQLALKTMNPRLGILGGLSILGTSGIVRPFSCAAYIASIHQGIDVAHTNGYTHIAACTGNASEDTMRRVYGLPEIALIEMGDFVGAVLKHLRKVPVPRLTLCGGFGKISKLAAGHMDLHSRHSSIDLPQLAGWAADIGADETLQAAIIGANTSQQALALAHTAGIALGDAVCAHALAFARSVVPAQVQVEVFAIDRQGGIVGQAGVQ